MGETIGNGKAAENTPGGEIDFRKPPEKLEDYKIGDPLTRENFISFLILSFAVSRGSQVLHQAFLDWLKYKYGFEFYGPIREFSALAMLPGKAALILTPEERIAFSDAYRNIPQHVAEQRKVNPIARVGTQLRGLPGPSRYNFDFEFDKIHNMADFNKKASEFLKLAYPSE